MKRGPYKGREALYEKARELRGRGLGYRSISAELAEPVAWQVIRAWVKDIPVSDRHRSEAHAEAGRRRRKPIEELAHKDQIRSRLIEERGRRCQCCGLTEWRDKPIPLELHRVYGGRYQDVDDCLLLCPNCHALTPNYKNRKRKPI